MQATNCSLNNLVLGHLPLISQLQMSSFFYQYILQFKKNDCVLCQWFQLNVKNSSTRCVAITKFFRSPFLFLQFYFPHCSLKQSNNVSGYRSWGYTITQTEQSKLSIIMLYNIWWVESRLQKLIKAMKILFGISLLCGYLQQPT